MLQEMGVRVWLPGAAFEPPAAATTRPAADTTVRAPTRSSLESPAPQAPPAPMPGAAPVAQAALTAATELDAMDGASLQQAATLCKACGLCGGRRQAILCAPGAGVQMDWMVVGDPPDEEEDRAGQVFVEQSGLLLDNMLKAVGASRGGAGSQGAYLSAVVKCRPPHARLPVASELLQCSAYLRREIALVQPKAILAMGRFAVQTLLGDYPDQVALPLGKQRGAVYRFAGVPVVVTYHPKVLLRASADKAKAWADLCLAAQVIQGTEPSLQSAP